MHEQIRLEMNFLKKINLFLSLGIIAHVFAVPLDLIQVIKPPLINKHGQFCIDLKDDHNHLFDALRIFWATKTNFADYFSYPNQINEWVTCQKPVERSVEPVITWIGHATFLIQINNINIVTDPVFFGLTMVYPRQSPVGIRLEDLPPIDLVIISHTHRDHLDEDSIKFINNAFKPRFLVPKGAKQWFLDSACENVMEFTWAEKTAYQQNDQFPCEFYFLPSVHWCNRGLFDINTALWGSWMIVSDNFKIYFAGDSAYSEHFKTIGTIFENIDVALLPIGPNEPRNLMEHSHVSAQEAYQAFIDLNARIFIPMHWGTFRLGTDAFIDPITLLSNSWNRDKNRAANKTLKIVKFGERVHDLSSQIFV